MDTGAVMMEAEILAYIKALKASVFLGGSLWQIKAIKINAC